MGEGKKMMGDEIICPHCEKEFSDSREYIHSFIGKKEIDCQHCDKRFLLTGIDYDVTYYTETLPTDNTKTFNQKLEG